MYDETPLRLRSAAVEALSGRRVNVELIDSTTAHSRPEAGKVQGIAKLFQSESVFSMLFRDRSSGRFTLHTVPLVVPVLMGDRMTGEVIRELMDEAEYIPGISHIRAGAEQWDGATADRASPNDRSEEARYYQSEVPRLRLPCAAHICATCQGRAFGTVSEDIAGIVAFSRSLRESAGVVTFREKIQEELDEFVRVSPLPPPQAGSPCSRRREAVMDLACPVAGAGTKLKQTIRRRFLLATFFTGAWDSDDIVFHAGSAAGVLGFNKKKWAVHASHALFPSIIPIQANGVSRWCNTVVPLGEYSLIASVHNLLFRAARGWLDMAPVCASLTDPWAIGDDTGDEAEKSCAVVEYETPCGVADKVGTHTETDAYMEFKNKQKDKVRRFVSSGCQNRLVVARTCLMLSVMALHSIETFGPIHGISGNSCAT